MTTTKPETKRCFVAIPVLEKEVIEELDRLANKLDKFHDGWTQEPLYHVTLRFLGDVDQDTLDRLLSLDAFNAPRSSGAQDMRLCLGKPGTFPKSNLVWVGVGGEDLQALETLQAEVERLAVGMGFPPADYPFTPHITVGRYRHIRRSTAPLMVADTSKATLYQYVKGTGTVPLASRAAEAHNVRPLPWSASHVHLLESTRTVSLVNYKSISTAPVLP